MGNYFLTASRWEADSSETYQQGCRTRQRTPESASCICKCFAVWCPGATSATEGASYNGNGAAWHKDSPKHWSACVLIPRIPLGSSELILGEKKKIPFIQCFTSGWVNATAQCAHSCPGCLLLCGSSKINFSLILLAAGMFPAQKGTVPQGLGSLPHTPKGDGAQVVTTITAKGVLPL